MPVGLHSGRVWRNLIFSLFPSLGDIYAELLLILCCSLSDGPSSGSKHRTTLIFSRSSLKEKLDVIQILDLSTEEEVVSEIEETDQFCSHVELVLARLDEARAAIAPKIEASSHASKEPTNEPAQSVSHVNILCND